MTPSYEERLRAAVRHDLEREVTPVELASRRGALVAKALGWSAGWAAAIGIPLLLKAETQPRSGLIAAGVWLGIVACLAGRVVRACRAERAQAPSIPDPAVVDTAVLASALCPACECSVPIRSSACPRCGEVLNPLREVLVALGVVALIVATLIWGVLR